MEIGFWMRQSLDETLLYTYNSVPNGYASTQWIMHYVSTPWMINFIPTPLRMLSIPTPVMPRFVPYVPRIHSDSYLSHRRNHGYNLPPRMRSQRSNNRRIHFPAIDTDEIILEQQNYLVGNELSQQCISDFLISNSGCLTVTHEEIICIICQDEINVKEEMTTLNCRHVYHAGCIEKWLIIKNKCPVCRASVILNEDLERDLY